MRGGTLREIAALGMAAAAASIQHGYGRFRADEIHTERVGFEKMT